MISNPISNVGFLEYQTDGTSKFRVQNSITVGDYKIINTDSNSNLISYAGTGTFTTNTNYEIS